MAALPMHITQSLAYTAYVAKKTECARVTGPDLLAGTSALVAKVPRAPYILCSGISVSQIPQDCQHRV